MIADNIQLFQLWTKGNKKGQKSELSIVATLANTIVINNGCAPQGSIVFVCSFCDQSAIVQVPKFSQQSMLQFEDLTIQEVAVPLNSLCIKPTTIIYKKKRSCITVQFGYNISHYE